MAMKNIVQAIPMSTFGGGALLPGVYQPINPGGLPQACFLIRIVNNTDEEISISYDGTTGHDTLQANTYEQLNFQTNSNVYSSWALMPKGTVVYVEGDVATGNVYLVGYFQPLNN